MLFGSKLGLIWLCIVLALAATLAHQLTASDQLPIETNIMALLPENRQDPVAQEAFDHVANGMGNKVIFLIGAPITDSKNKKQTPILAAKQFAQSLKNIGMFNKVTGIIGQSAQQAWGKVYFPKRYQLLTAEQQARLRSAPIQQVQRVIQAVYNPFSGITGAELASDPFLLFRDYLSQLTSGSGNFTLNNGFLTTHYKGMTYALVTADLRDSPYSFALQKRLPALDDLERQLEHKYGVQVLHTGVIFYAANGTESAEHEIGTIGLGSLIGIILLLLLVYRSPLPLGLALLSIGCGLLAGFVLTVAVFGKVHLFSLVFGASLIGVSIDYAFHYLTDRLSAGKDWDASAGLKHIFAAITLGLITSLIGYLGMLVAPFPGLQQLSLFSVAGLIAAYATVVCWYPILAKNPGRTLALPLRQSIVRWLTIWQHRGVRIALPLLLLIASLAGLYHAQYNDDIRQLQALPTALKQQEDAIKTITGVGNSQQMLLVKAADEQALLDKLQRVSQRLDVYRTQGVLEGFQSLSKYLPSEAVQADNFALVQHLYQEQGAMLRQRLGLSAPIKFAASFNPLTPAAFLASPASAPLRFLWLGRLHGVQAAIITLNGVAQPEVIKKFAATDAHLSYLDKADEVSSLFGEYRVRVTELLIAATLAIAALLAWRYGIKKGALVILPPVIAGCAGIAVTTLTGTPLNLFNLLALVLILGVGIDYTLFFAEQDKGGDTARLGDMGMPLYAQSTLLAISLSAATTLLSFGLLALSDTQAIHSFGITVSTGIIVAWLLAPLSVARTGSRPTTPIKQQ